MTLTILDAILVAIMLVSALLAMVRGFSREVLSVVAWAVSAFAAFYFFEPLTPYVSQYVNNEKVAMAIAAAGVFFVTLIIVSFITLKIADFIIDSRIGALDRVLGFIFGAVRGLLLVVVAMLFFNWLAPENQPSWVANAASKPFLDDLGQQLVAALPENPQGAIFDQLDGLAGRAEDDPATGEPTMAHLTDTRGDTVHLDIVDRWGNMVSATPSGGWLQSCPVVPGLGFPLNSRAQMFWLDAGLPSSLTPGARPRTTLTPSIAYGPNGEVLSFGTPGGDQQDQWQLVWFLRFVHHGFDLQQGIDAPLFHSQHFQASFYPREAKPGTMMIEATIGPVVVEALKARGHDVVVAEPNSVGRLTAALRHEDGMMQAAATPRLMQAYAIGR